MKKSKKILGAVIGVLVLAAVAFLLNTWWTSQTGQLVATGKLTPEQIRELKGGTPAKPAAPAKPASPAKPADDKSPSKAE